MKLITDEQNLKRMFTRLAHEALENNSGTDGLALLGIRTGGVFVANRLAEEILKIEGIKPEVGVIDPTLYRDDLMSAGVSTPKGTEVDFDINGKNIVLCDDVLFTGRTVRAAVSAVMDVGRPKTIRFLVIVDRGHRELPFRADFIGKNIPTSRSEKVKVYFKEKDGKEGIYLFKEGEPLL